MKIAILGTRGIPNQYGGFEQFADILSQGLEKKGYDITVYCSNKHSYKESIYNNVKLIHKVDPENKIGTAGQFIYDLYCILDAKKKNFDVIYLLGYTSSSIWQRLLYKKAKTTIVTNMDGLEWKRSKYSKPVQHFLKWAEKLAVKYSNHLVADSIGIQSYLTKKYNKNSTYIPYGSYIFKNAEETTLTSYGLKPYQYDILIARFEPENNIEMIIEAYHQSHTQRQLVLIGNYKHTKFGNKIFKKYIIDKRIIFLGSIYDQKRLNNLRFYSNLYFHGHSVGGTNPSLLEAMGSSALICFHDNDFNKAIVGNDGFAFSTVSDLKTKIEEIKKENYPTFILNNINKIDKIYKWEIITNQYDIFFKAITKRK
jgi:glycosyltransferase involved in cell wall biosynthesis